jgi:hypothetical protein
MYRFSRVIDPGSFEFDWLLTVGAHRKRGGKTVSHEKLRPEHIKITHTLNTVKTLDPRQRIDPDFPGGPYPENLRPYSSWFRPHHST